MSARYNVPCPTCHQPVQVGTPQAGQLVRCSCGADLEVPTLRVLEGMTPLPPPSSAPRAGVPWTIGRGITFVLGSVMGLIAVTSHVRLTQQLGSLDLEKPDLPQVETDLDRLTPSDAWTIWTTYFRSRTLEGRATPEYLLNRRRFQTLSRWRYFSWSVGIAGAGLVVGSLVGPRLSRRVPTDSMQRARGRPAR